MSLFRQRHDETDFRCFAFQNVGKKSKNVGKYVFVSSEDQRCEIPGSAGSELELAMLGV